MKIRMDEEDNIISSDVNEVELTESEEGSGSDTKPEMYDYLFNVIVVGDSGVGKTDLIGRLCDEEGYQTKFVTTMGMNVVSHVLDVNEKKIRLQLWDPSGSDKYLHVTKKYFAKASGVVFVYDIAYAKSFQNIAKWIEFVRQNAGADLPKVLVGNKSDIKRRVVTNEQAEKLSQTSGMTFMETSAINGDNVTQIFSSLCEVMISVHDKNLTLE